jgi:anti-anti-sigma factor
MTILTRLSRDNATLTIDVVGRFDYRVHAEFRRAYEAVSPTPERVVVDLAQTDFIDSSALGMLLLLRQHCGGDDTCVTLVNAKPAVARVLGVAAFPQMFQVA